MEKPFTLRVQDFMDKLAEAINNANLPAYAIKKVLEETFNQVTQIEQEDIAKYNEEIQKLPEMQKEEKSDTISKEK